MNKCSIYGAIFMVLVGHTNALAQSSEDINSFITEVSAPPYDCPKSSDMPQINEYLSNDTISSQQRLNLQTISTHIQICDGDSEKAALLLDDIINRADIDHTSYAYAMAHYQRGFVFDVQENPKRCEYYEQAKQLSESNFPKILLSATLGLTTACGNTSDTEKLGTLLMFAETLTTQGDPKALAHLHNSIGLIYGQLGHHVLAAEQYMKAHTIGLPHYEGTNKLTILVSAISSFMASGMFDEAESALNEFRIINDDVNTPLTNFYEVFLEAGYFYRTENYPELAVSVKHWEENIKQDISSSLYHDLFMWYQTAECVENKDIACMADYLEHESTISSRFIEYTSTNKDYLQFKAELLFALKRYDEAEIAYEVFADKLAEMAEVQQASSSLFGVANLYSQIVQLEDKVASVERQKIKTLWGFAAVVLFTIVIFGEFVRRRNLARLSIDPATQLLNARSAISKISKLETPTSGKANALAIFDLANFREVNRRLGASRGDDVLLKVSKVFKQVTRDSDIVGRFAPEQFILCLTNVEEEIAKTFFDRVHTALESAAIGTKENEEINVRSSMSIYISHTKFDNLNATLDQMVLSLSLQK